MMAAMKPETREVFEYIKKNNDQDMTAADVTAGLGWEPDKKKKVDGAFTSFAKKGWGVRVPAEVEMADGSHKQVKLLHLTPEGLAVDLDLLQ